eukprot:CAMPEP_0172525902 /NCGR_PEP_ID=MMETSP1067-20121228/912_1 /TAXON_ID=265564 ORGANISM="Thalassiosira punctigera, Strain Tpunct2005C2" /NCGR_SAMPLE_ID=MMETSP1067 /ASSEMBLY_ACC=CAM_ASM_000444 /LENGTH=110 /DNA_ID=CAMNT_0013309289 /DNA_START=633 /DNA_END=962 /DNA_ORIENTATION=+
MKSRLRQSTIRRDGKCQSLLARSRRGARLGPLKSTVSRRKRESVERAASTRRPPVDEIRSSVDWFHLSPGDLLRRLLVVLRDDRPLDSTRTATAGRDAANLPELGSGLGH